MANYMSGLSGKERFLVDKLSPLIQDIRFHYDVHQDRHFLSGIIHHGPNVHDTCLITAILPNISGPVDDIYLNSLLTDVLTQIKKRTSVLATM